MENSKIIHYCTELDVLGWIIAAAGHDVGHPALTNRFLINSRDNIAIRYNDQSVLEQMHCCITFGLLQEKKNDILANFSWEDWQVIRKVIVDMILGTDMSKHFDMLGNFRGRYLTTQN